MKAFLIKNYTFFLILLLSLIFAIFCIKKLANFYQNKNYINTRKSEYPVLDVIINRWSSRAMSGQEISDLELMSLFEAAKWAPSPFNNQPWRFIYVKRDSSKWQDALSLLYQGNRLWSKDAAVLVLALSYKYSGPDKKLSRTHSFDTGGACQNLAIQGCYMDLVVHPVEGFDYEKAREFFKIDPDYDIEVMYVIGKPGNPESLPENLRKLEQKSDRKNIVQFVFKDEFNNKI